MSTSAWPRLGLGQFYGDIVAGFDAGGVSVREVEGIPETGVPRHTHEDAHFCLIVRGEYETTSRSRQLTCRRSTLLFHPAGTTHEDRLRSRRGACLMVSLEQTYLHAHALSRLPARSIVLDDAEIGFAGHRIRRELHEMPAFPHFGLDALALELVAHLFPAAARLEQRVPGWLPAAREFVRRSATAPASVRDVAASVGVHPVHLARAFRRHLGLSPAEYLRRVRVARALRLIEESADPLSLIAIRCGFGDQSEMTKAIRREAGSTPGACRRALRRVAFAQDRSGARSPQ
jgi:AraC family transcriptional regulator